MLARETDVTVRVYIDRLILDGLPVTHHQGSLVQAAVSAELERLLSESGLPASLDAGVALPSVRANGIQLTSENSPTQLGTQIAGSVYSSIGDTQ
jgi:hypothetical protein